eukprot:gene3629-14866_t
MPEMTENGVATNGCHVDQKMNGNGLTTEDISPSSGKQNSTLKDGAPTSEQESCPSDEMKKTANGSNNSNGIESHLPEQNGRHEGNDSVLMIKMLSDEAVLPTRGSFNAAGYDLYSAVDCLIPAKDKALVSTKIAITVPYGSYGRIAPRSGLAVKHFIDVGAGVIDRDYTGEVGVLLFNFSDKAYQVSKKERIAQLVIEKIFTPELKVVDELPKSDRGGTGYGASGKF